MVGRVQDHLSGSIILLELDDLRIRIVALERENVAHVRATKHVDRLIVIPHDREVPVLAGEMADHQILGAVGVLVLVDHDVLESLLVLLEHLGMAVEQPHGPHQQVVEVERAVLLENGVVAHPDLRSELLVVSTGGGGLVLGGDDLVLGARDQRHHAPRGIPFFVEAHLVHHTLDHRQSVRLVVDDEVAIDPIGAAVAPEDANADRMEGPHPDPTRGQVEQLLDSAAHLPRRLVGERHRQDFAGLGPSLLDQPGDPVGQHPRLATAGAGKDQQRPVLCGDGGALRRIESG